MRITPYLFLLIIVLLAATIVPPLTIVGRTIMIATVILTVVLMYLDHHQEEGPPAMDRLLVFSFAGLVLSVLVGVASLFWSCLSLVAARANASDEAEASLMVGIVVLNCFWVLLYGTMFGDCRRKQTSEQDKIVRG